MELENKFKRKRSSSIEELKDINKRALSSYIDKLPMNLHKPRPNSAPLGIHPSKTAQEDDSDNLQEQNNALFRKLYLKSRSDCPKGDEESSNKAAGLEQVDNDSNANNLAESDASEDDSDGSDSESSENEGDAEAARLEYMQSFIRCIDELQETLNEGCSDAESDSNENPFEALLEPGEDDPATPEIAHTLGFLACAQGAMKCLHDKGVKSDDPFMVSLKRHLINGLGKYRQN